VFFINTYVLFGTPVVGIVNVPPETVPPEA